MFFGMLSRGLVPTDCGGDLICFKVEGRVGVGRAVRMQVPVRNDVKRQSCASSDFDVLGGPLVRVARTRIDYKMPLLLQIYLRSVVYM